MGDSDDRAELRRRVDELQWYHTFELAPGVVTPGWMDTRKVVDKVPIPQDLSGMRCLDVGTFDGFWAFLMEQRGATEVVAVDVPDPRQWDWPADATEEAVEEIARRRPGAGFALVAEVQGSKVRREECTVYDLDRERVGTFDFVYLGSLLVHLRDPIGALMRVRDVCSGTLLVVDAADLRSSMSRVPRATLDGRGRPWWWIPNLAALIRMVEAAGFRVERPVTRFFMPPGPAVAKPPLSRHLLTSRAGREAALRAWKGDPHAAIVAHPT